MFIETNETINVNYTIMCLKLHVYTVNKICEITYFIVDQLLESKYTGFTGKMRFHYITAFNTTSNSYIFFIIHVILFSVNHSYCRISHILVYQNICMGAAITGATTSTI